MWKEKLTLRKAISENPSMEVLYEYEYSFKYSWK